MILCAVILPWQSRTRCRTVWDKEAKRSAFSRKCWGSFGAPNDREIGGVILQEFLYRYISFESFVGMVQSKALTFVLPELWDDPKECAPFEQLLYSTDNLYERIFLIAVYNKTYSQCWTRVSESDAMWRIYSYNNRALQIKVSEKKLCLLPDIRLVPVIYSDQIEINETKNIDKFLRSLAIKRRAFQHEDEIRLIKHYKFLDDDDFEKHVKAFLAVSEHPQMVEIIESLFPGLPPKEQIESIANLLNTGKSRKVAIDISYESIPDFIDGVLVHPLAPDWYVKIVAEYCKRNALPFDGQSTLYCRA